MAALKLLVFVSILIAAMAAAQATITLPNTFPIITVQAAVFCTIDGNIGVNGIRTPPFPNATVQLQCNGAVVANATTNASGVVVITVNPVTTPPSLLLGNCRLVVITPRSTCNAILPSTGTLTSPLVLAGTNILGLLRFIIFTALRFRIVV